MVETDLWFIVNMRPPRSRGGGGAQEGGRGSLRELAERGGARDANALAEELLLVMDGAWSAARVFGPGSHGRRASRAAKDLIAAHV